MSRTYPLKLSSHLEFLDKIDCQTVHYVQYYRDFKLSRPLLLSRSLLKHKIFIRYNIFMLVIHFQGHISLSFRTKVLIYMLPKRFWVSVHTTKLLMKYYWTVYCSYWPPLRVGRYDVYCSIIFHVHINKSQRWYNNKRLSFLSADLNCLSKISLLFFMKSFRKRRTLRVPMRVWMGGGGVCVWGGGWVWNSILSKFNQLKFIAYSLKTFHYFLKCQYFYWYIALIHVYFVSYTIMYHLTVAV